MPIIPLRGERYRDVFDRDFMRALKWAAIWTYAPWVIIPVLLFLFDAVLDATGIFNTAGLFQGTE